MVNLDEVLEGMLGPPAQGWMGQEFVPSLGAAPFGAAPFGAPAAPWGAAYMGAQWEAAVAQHAAVQQSHALRITSDAVSVFRPRTRKRFFEQTLDMRLSILKVDERIQ